ncbi:MAG: DedA family protein [Bacilli bacterium]|nr:DedA family protein [Bacilli bacterium]
MNKFIMNIMNKYGYLGILFLITIENIFPPIPSEVILTLGGFMTSQENCTMNMLGVILFSTLGSIIGAILLYFLGYILNKERLLKIVDSRVGKILFLKKSDIEKSIDSFNTKGNFSVLYSRFIPIVRSLISIPAGISKMNFSVFLLYTSIGSVIWNTVLIYLGNLVGENYMMVANVFSKYSKFVLVLIILVIVYKIIKKLKKKN